MEQKREKIGWLEWILILVLVGVVVATIVALLGDKAVLLFDSMKSIFVR